MHTFIAEAGRLASGGFLVREHIPLPHRSILVIDGQCVSATEDTGELSAVDNSTPAAEVVLAVQEALGDVDDHHRQRRAIAGRANEIAHSAWGAISGLT